MGIKDLLKAFQSEARVKMITDFRGKRIAIDASGWLHKGLYAAAEDFVDSGIDSQLYVDFILARARNFILNGVEPIFVFDGKRNSLKTETCRKRNESREMMVESGKKLVDNMARTHDHACRMKLRQEALACFQRGLDVTHEMEVATIAGLRRLNIQCIVAPYEADAQLAYLCRIGHCDAVLTEDSDLLVYSAVCGVPFPILYKFDKGGTAQCLDLESIGILEKSSSSTNGIQSNTSITTTATTTANNETKSKTGTFRNSLKQFKGPTGRRMFVQMCILAGTDYIESINGVGIVTAQQAIVKFKTSRDDERVQCALEFLKSTKKVIPDGYLARAARVEALFHYQPVYNPVTKTIESLMPCPEIDSCESEWAGPKVSDAVFRSLGTREDIMKHFPSGMTIEEMGEAYRSCKNFDYINPGFPWERGKLTTPNGPQSNLWVIRRNMIHYIETHGGAMIQMENSRSNDLRSINSFNNCSNNNNSYRSGHRNQPRPRSLSSGGRRKFMHSKNTNIQAQKNKNSGLRNEIPSFEQFASVASASMREIMHPPEVQTSSSRVQSSSASTQPKDQTLKNPDTSPQITMNSDLSAPTSQNDEDEVSICKDTKIHVSQDRDKFDQILDPVVTPKVMPEKTFVTIEGLDQLQCVDEKMKAQNNTPIVVASTPRVSVADNIGDDDTGVTKISPTEKVLSNDLRNSNSSTNLENIKRNKMKFEEKFPKGVPMQPSPKKRKIEAVSILGKKGKSNGVAAIMKVASIKSFFS